jgi:hypothetical protein
VREKARVTYSRSLLLLVAAVLLTALVPVAYATPPDPTWIAGYWDDGDFDSAVLFLVSACAVAVSPAPDAAPHWGELTGIDVSQPCGARVTSRAAASPRAPPLA